MAEGSRCRLSCPTGLLHQPKALGSKGPVPALPLTELFKHLVTFIQDKVFNVFQVEALISS